MQLFEQIAYGRKYQFNYFYIQYIHEFLLLLQKFIKTVAKSQKCEQSMHLSRWMENFIYFNMHQHLRFYWFKYFFSMNFSCIPILFDSSIYKKEL